MRLVPTLSAAVLAATAVTVAPAAASSGQASTDRSESVRDDKVDRSLSPERQFCTTQALSPTQLRAGELSVVDCYATREVAEAAAGLHATLDEDGVARAASNWHLAEHFDYNGIGPVLIISGPSCDGSGLSFAAHDPWNDRISSTRPLTCGKVKHWQHFDRTGDLETALGSGQLTILGALNNEVSSTSYLP